MKTELRTEQMGPLQASLPPAASELDLSELKAALKSHRCCLGQQLSGFLIKTVKHHCASFLLNSPRLRLGCGCPPSRPLALPSPSRRELCPPALALPGCQVAKGSQLALPVIISQASRWLPGLPCRSSALMSHSKPQLLRHRGEKTTAKRQQGAHFHSSSLCVL